MKRISILLGAAILAGSAAGIAHEGPRSPAVGKEISREEHPWGREGDPRKAVRTIAIDMSDAMRFAPSEVRVKAGETVRFVARNKGKLMHEMVIGTKEELEKHAELMRKHPAMEHDEPYMAHVKPGGKEEIAWTFSKPGTFMYGCLIPGHWEAGMKGTIVVAANAVDASAATEGEVRKVDKGAKKITLKHQEIRNLDMPAMTMVFVVKDEAMLDRVKTGDKVRFTAEKLGGAFTITSIDPAK
jgi:uncharacterized cupredoxin-like copper-binding protein